MTKREWKPGDVAMVTSRKGGPCASLRTSSHTWRCQHGSTVDENVSDARPLVVIDPEDREQVERLIDAYVDIMQGDDTNGTWRRVVHRMQAALREFANPKPPRPDEPTGWLAAVEDSNRWRWFSHGSGHKPWQRTDGKRADYDDIDVVRVLSEGVPVE